MCQQDTLCVSKILGDWCVSKILGVSARYLVLARYCANWTFRDDSRLLGRSERGYLDVQILLNLGIMFTL